MERVFKYVISLIVALGLLAIPAFAITDPAGGATEVGATGQYTATTAGTAVAQGGNVTGLNLSSNASTSKWQGFYGNVSGGLLLGSGSTVFYDFGNTDFTTVFAAPATDVNWATLAATTPAEIDTQWSFGTASDVDQAADIYTLTDTFAGVASVPATNISSGGFRTGILEDGDDAAKGDYVFGGIINSSGATGFGGNTYEFQLMVPVETGTETYNFYLSLE